MCWAILLVLFFPLATPLLKTKWLLVWPFAVWKIKLSWAIARVFHLMRGTWTRSSGWVGWRGTYWAQPLCVSSSSEPADSSPESQRWILLMKSSQQELSFSEISKPYQLAEAHANNQEQPGILFPGKAWGRLTSISLGEGKPFLCFMLWWHINISGIQEQYSHRKKIFLLSVRLQTHFWGCI